MRTIMTVSMDTDKANEVILAKRLQEFMQSRLAALKPEAAYFWTLNGKRGGFVVFDLKEPAQIPSIAEPFFQELGAEVSFSPVMVPEDIGKGLDPDYTPPA
ncbi:DUF3303 family protein [Streptacidiphilus melanogenes]|uniref:DUF3303 family protein n=1 Tax=Streptacidiphilus melanogenes TaxID=411235 RepID=UPI0005AA817B|nr:DUF3303 family protein [Streptacidiphilus melanogenes]